MSFNSSSSANASLHPPHLPSSNSSLDSASTTCFTHRLSFFIFTTFAVTNILLLLPLCIFVLYLGLRQWQKQHSATMAATTSHSDVFTYHMVTMEMIGIFGSGFYCYGVGFNVLWLIEMGASFFSATSQVQIFFHILSCVERHLAVVHPITYLSLRKGGAVRIRNITIGCIWLLYFGCFGLSRLGWNYNLVPSFCLTVLSIPVVSFCSLSVLRALIRPGPGDGEKDRERVDKSKMRAFHTIMAIMGVLLLRFGGSLLGLAIYVSSAVNEHVRCVALASGVWFILPSSLVLPLLFLHRAGKLACCRYNTEPGQGSE